MARERGELSLSEAADALGVHYNTALNWALEALSGGASRFEREGLRRDLTRRIWVSGAEVKRLRDAAVDEALSGM